MVKSIEPHDLLWGLQAHHVPAAPDWVVRVLTSGQPVVVRRSVAGTGKIAVGVRGSTRDRRFATTMEAVAVTRRVCPEELCHPVARSDLAALRALAWLRPRLDDCGWIWGVAGSAGFELASGVPALHEHSDLDLILRTAQPMGRSEARRILGVCDGAPCPVDIQLQTPLGGVALREWAAGKQRVLLKSAQGAYLTSDPWGPQELAS